MPNQFERPPISQESGPEQLAEKQEAITLRFPEIYQSPEWKDLPKIGRAQLLLVAEGAKPGTIIGGNFTSFQKIVAKMGLATRLNTEDSNLEPVYEIATPEILNQHHHELVSLPEKAPAEDIHRIDGKFLGYPACCTEEYIQPIKNRAEIIQRYGPKEAENITNVEYEARQLVEQGKPYPEELDYRPPTYTPCSATCDNALATLSKWKKLLDYADPEAAQRLKQFNWQDEPYRSVHQAEMDKEGKAEIKEEKLQFLRKSAGLQE